MRCPKCKKLGAYIRMSTDEMVCNKCGHVCLKAEAEAENEKDNKG